MSTITTVLLTVSALFVAFCWGSVALAKKYLRKIGFSEFDITILHFRREVISAALLCRRYGWTREEIITYMRTGIVPERFRKILED